ncbi:MAG: DMT family transporter [Pseudomonadota bacterium]|nr:DMT family transporter [Pseudomonadota bacterium]
MRATASPDTLIRLMPAVFVLIWATGFIVARYGMPHAPPFGFLVLRFSLSVACFVLWVWLARVRWPQTPAQWSHLAVTGILLHAVYLGGVWSAVKSGMGAGLTALIAGLQPVLTAVWLAATGIGGQRVSQRQWLGLMLGLVGLLLVVWRKLTHGSPGDHVTLLNLGWAVLGLLAITAGTLYQKRFVKPCDVRSAGAVQLTAAALVLLPLAALEAESIQWNGQVVGAMAWSVLGLTLGGSSLLYLLIQRGAAASVASLMYLVPPTTAVIAWLLFAEPITALTLAGMALTAVGVALVVRAPAPSTSR